MAEISGGLSERVRFEARSDVRGGAGEHSGAWQMRFERWAAVQLLPRSEQSVAVGDTRHSARRWRVILRDGVRPTLDMRMRWRDETLVPTAIEADLLAPGRIVVWAVDAASRGV